MALINFCRNTILKAFAPKWRNSSAFTSSNSEPENTCEQQEKSEDQKSEGPSENDGSPEPRVIKIETPEDVKKRQLQKCKLLIREPDNYYLISGVPIELTRTRPARIYQPAKNAMQSGTRHLGHWLIDFETKDRWKNPLMGWCSSGDCLSNLQIRFSTKEQAIDYCKKNNMAFRVQESKTHKKFKPASYALNFHYKKRTRLSTK